MKSLEQIERARNLLTLVLLHDALDREPEIFKTGEEIYDAVFSTGILYWLFGDDTGRVCCPHHETCDFARFLEVMKSRLIEAGYPDPESDAAYRRLKERRPADNFNLFSVLTQIRSEEA